MAAEMETQTDNINISQLRAFALGLNHDSVSSLMHLMPVAAGMHTHTNAIFPIRYSLSATRP